MRLTERVYYYPWNGKGNNCNTYLFRGPEVVLIDPGHISNESGVNCYENLVHLLKLDGIGVLDIDYIFCTHCHPDHCEAVLALKKEKDIPTVMHPEEEPHRRLILNFSDYYERLMGKKLILPAIDIYQEEGLFELGGETIQLLHTPGHSPGSLSFYFPLEKALVTGDLIFKGNIGRTDAPGGSLQRLRDSMFMLSARTGAEWLLPGHGEIVTGKKAVEDNFALIEKMFFPSDSMPQQS